MTGSSISSHLSRAYAQPVAGKPRIASNGLQLSASRSSIAFPVKSPLSSDGSPVTSDAQNVSSSPVCYYKRSNCLYYRPVLKIFSSTTSPQLFFPFSLQKLFVSIRPFVDVNYSLTTPACKFFPYPAIFFHSPSLSKRI